MAKYTFVGDPNTRTGGTPNQMITLSANDVKEKIENISNNIKTITNSIVKSRLSPSSTSLTTKSVKDAKFTINNEERRQSLLNKLRIQNSDHIKNIIIQKWNNVTGFIKNKASEVIDSIQSHTNSFIDEITSSIFGNGWIAQRINGGIKFILNSVFNSVKFVFKNIGNVFRGAGWVFNNLLFKPLKYGFKIAGKAMKGLFQVTVKAFRALAPAILSIITNPYVLLGIAIIALIALITIAIKRYGKQIWSWTKNLGKMIWDGITDFFTKIWDWFKDSWIGELLGIKKDTKIDKTTMNNASKIWDDPYLQFADKEYQEYANKQKQKAETAKKLDNIAKGDIKELTKPKNAEMSYVNNSQNINNVTSVQNDNSDNSWIGGSSSMNNEWNIAKSISF